jgi:hypothetical protein
MTDNDQPCWHLRALPKWRWTPQDCPPEVCSLDELHAWLISTHLSVKPIDGNSWQRAITPKDHAAGSEIEPLACKAYGRGLAPNESQNLVPISRQLIKFPITPNMVSTLLLELASPPAPLLRWQLLERACRECCYPVWAAFSMAAMEGCPLKLLESVSVAGWRQSAFIFALSSMAISY